MISSSRVKLGVALTSGSAAAIGTPIALHYSQVSDTETTKLSENSVDLHKVEAYPDRQIEDNDKIDPNTVRSRAKRSLGEESSAPSSTHGEEKLNTEQNNKKFEELWTRITTEYEKAQKTIKNQEENQLSWKTQFSNILLNEGNLGDKWEVKEEKYKDCSRVTGGKTDYCGYLNLTRGNSEYRLKFDRYGEGGKGRKWDVFIVRKKGRGVNYYSQTNNKWTNSPTSDINNFQGESRSQYNWWNKLSLKSIEV